MKRPEFSDKADQKFFEQSRKLSPRFPDVATALERRRDTQEKIAARVLLWGLVPAGILTVPWSSFGWWMIAAGLSGFIAVCYAAGARITEKNGGRGGRPF